MSGKLNVNPRLPAPGQIDYERAMNRATQVLFQQTAQQVNDLAEGRIAAKYQAAATIPTSGAYNAGDYVEKLTKSVTTASDSTYVIMGWIRMTSGSLHVLGTDWLEDRHFLSVIFPADTDTDDDSAFLTAASFQGSWQTPTYQNSWVDFNASTDQAGRYTIDAAGWVTIQGEVKSGTIGSAIFTLPAGFRPPTKIIFAVDSNSAYGRLDILSTGAVTPIVGSNASFAMSCRFRTT